MIADPTLFDDQRMSFDAALELTAQSLRAWGMTHRHWCIAYSGGKDSSAMVTAVCHLISTGRVPAPESLTVLYADTRMELPPLQAAAMAKQARRPPRRSDRTRTCGSSKSSTKTLLRCRRRPPERAPHPAATITFPMRIRTIKPEFWANEKMSAMPDAARLLALGLLNYSDDEGYFWANEKMIRGALRPFDDDSTIIRRSLAQLASIGYLMIGKTDDGRECGVIVNFAKHQKIDRPKPSEIKGLASFDDQSSIIRRGLDDQSLLDRKGKDQGKEGINTSAKSGDLSGAPAEPSKPTRARDPLFDALASACDRDPHAMTARDARACGVAMAEIRKASPDVTPTEIARRAANYRSRYREAALTPSALCNQWAACATGTTRAANGGFAGEVASVRPKGWGTELPLTPAAEDGRVA